MYVIVDGSSVAYRAWHSAPIRAFKNVPDEKEEIDSVAGLFLYAFCSQLVKIIRQVDMSRPKFSKLLICWDGVKSTTLRKQLYPEYKSNRKKNRDVRTHITPYTFIQITRLELGKVSARFGLYDEMAEADDIIAVLCDVLNSSYKCVVSRDKDMFQLINGNTKVLDPFSGEWVDEQAVFNQFGIKASQIVEYKSIVGDSSDGYPGIKGVGNKTGVRMINSGMNYQVSNKECSMFRKIATIPYPDFDDKEFLKTIEDLKFSELPRWGRLSEDWDFNDRFRLALSMVV